MSDLGDYSLNLTADADPTHSPIVPGTPLSGGLYTLEYQTDSLLGSQVTFVVAPLPGDFNGDGIVDAADYTIWSDTLGSTANLAADGNGNGTIDAGDYTVWLSNFGRAYGSGSGATITTTTVPEPATSAMLLSGWPPPLRSARLQFDRAPSREAFRRTSIIDQQSMIASGPRPSTIPSSPSF